VVETLNWEVETETEMEVDMDYFPSVVTIYWMHIEKLSFYRIDKVLAP